MQTRRRTQAGLKQSPTLSVRWRALALLGLLLLVTGASPANETFGTFRQEGSYGFLRLPSAGVADVRLSENGQLAIIEAVTFNREKDVPERVVFAVDLGARQVQSRIALPAVDCCSYPVFSVSSDGQIIAVGGADRVELFSPRGEKVMNIALRDPTLNTSLKISSDGRVIVVGQSSGRITTFHRGRREPLWSIRPGADLLDLALSGDGRKIVAVTPPAALILAVADGSVLRRIPFGPSFAVAVAASTTGDPFALAWRRDPWKREFGMLVTLFSNGKWVWNHTFQEGEFPILQTDSRAKWVAVGDVMGVGGALLSGAGHIAWRSGEGRTAVGVASDGRVAIVEGVRAEIRDPTGRRTTWKGTLPGTALALRLAGPTLAVLGTQSPGSRLPDRAWFVDVGAN